MLPLPAGRALLAAAALGFALLALAPTPASAEPEIAGVEVVAADALTVGDRFHYVIRIEAAQGTDLSIPPGALPLAFEVTNTPKPAIRSLGGGRVEVTFDLEVAVFVPGSVPIPPIEIAYREPGGATGAIRTPQGLILVTSVLPAGEQLVPRDLKPQLEIGTASRPVVIPLTLGVILLAIAAFSVLVLLPSRKKRRLLLAAKNVTLNLEMMGPEDRANAVLEAAGVAFGNDRDFVAYYGAIAVAVRQYLTERYGFHAFALTTAELGAEMNRRGIDRWQARLVNGLLTQCDAAVYARYTPALERAGHDLTAALEIVEMSRPQPEPLELPTREEVATP